MAKDIIGLDISDASIEAVVLHKRAKSFSVESYSRYRISPGIIDNGRLLKADKLKEALLNMFKNGHPRPLNPAKVYFSIPESRAFVKTLQVPKSLKAKEISEAIQHQAEESTPESFENLATAHQVLQDVNNHREYTYIACEADVARDYIRLFKDLNIDIAGITTESIAAIAGLNDKFKKNTTLLLDLGSKVTIASIYDSHGIRSSINIGIGGNGMLDAVKDRLNISLLEAENKLRDIGLTATPGDGEVMLILQGQLQPLTDEIKRFVTYWQETANIKIEQLVLTGGLTQMRGLAEYFSANLSAPAFIGESFLSDHKDKDQIVFTKYINALGLARLATVKSDLNFYAEQNKIKFDLLTSKNVTIEEKENSNQAEPTEDSEKETPLWKKIITNTYFILALVLISLFAAFWFLRGPIRTLFNPKVSFDFVGKSLVVGIENKSGAQDFVFAQLVPFTLSQQRDYKDLSYQDVRNNILTDMNKQLIDGLNVQYTKGQLHLIPAVIDTDIEEVSPSAENFSLGQALTVRATFQVLGVNKEEIKNILINQLSDPKDKQKAANLEIKSFSYSLQNIDSSTQTATLLVTMTISNK